MLISELVPEVDAELDAEKKRLVKERLREYISYIERLTRRLADVRQEYEHFLKQDPASVRLESFRLHD